MGPIIEMLTHFKKIWAYSFYYLKQNYTKLYALFGGEIVITVKLLAETRVNIQEIDYSGISI